MLFTTLFTFAAAAVASPVSRDIRPWKAAGPGDSRGPCPMVNTLANHGYLPHNGRNISVEQFGEAVQAATNLEALFGSGTARIFANGWGHDVFDLEDLHTPGLLQHVSSLTRDDSKPGAMKPVPNPNRIARMFADSPSKYVTIDTVATTRIRDEKASLPATMNESQTKASLLEGALVATLMMEGPIPAAATMPKKEQFFAPKDRVKVWLSEERFPTELGWGPSVRRVLVVDLLPPVKYLNDTMHAMRGN
ncbi:Chloroperoxidase-like protein [Cladobotryum mycophilum]|uniref:Chloroperoxidase-like protein n=1 Tax=Cladobotryum mycophilum TaxID=491253 RepID=A0ABR0SUJ4_9HYPO